MQWGSTYQPYDRFGFEDGAENRVGTLKWYAAQHNGQWDDLDIQIGFIDWELKNSEQGAGDALAKAKTPQEASDIIEDEYERPKTPDASRELRANYAASAYYNVVMHINQVKINNLAETNAVAPSVQNGLLPTYQDITDYLDKKYDNNENGLLANSDLETLGQQWGDAQLYPAAADAFRQLAAAFENHFGKPLLLSGDMDAYRPFGVQIATYTDGDKIDANSPSTSTDDSHMGAEPGTSNHGYGLAVDLASNVNVLGSPEYQWVLDNAGTYGFGKEPFAVSQKIEPWHFTYAGGVQLPTNNNSGGTETGTETGLKNYNGPISKAGYGLPVPADSGFYISVPYEGYSDDRDGNVHTGTDYAVPVGTPGLAIRDGKVFKVGYSDQPGGADPDGAGNYIMVMLDNGHIQTIEHLSKVNVSVGDSVKLGDEIGESGNTGRSEGPHLHITINEVGYEGIPSHLETIDQVEAQTLDPESVLPSVDDAKDWLHDHTMRTLVQRLGGLSTTAIAGSTDTNDDVSNESGKSTNPLPNASKPLPNFQQNLQKRMKLGSRAVHGRMNSGSQQKNLNSQKAQPITIE